MSGPVVIRASENQGRGASWRGQYRTFWHAPRRFLLASGTSGRARQDSRLPLPILGFSLGAKSWSSGGCRLKASGRRKRYERGGIMLNIPMIALASGLFLTVADTVTQLDEVGAR